MTWSTVRRAGRPWARLSVACGLSLLGACGSGTTYSYVNVAVSVDTTTFSSDDLMRVGDCQVLIGGVEAGQAFDLRGACFPGQTRADLGTFQWSTTETKGWVTFEVFFYLFDSIVPLARGISPQVNIVKGKSVDTAVIVQGVPDTTGFESPDAGEPAAGADAGSDGGLGAVDAQPDSVAADAG